MQISAIIETWHGIMWKCSKISSYCDSFPSTVAQRYHDNFLSTRDNFLSTRDNFLSTRDNFLSTRDNFLSTRDNYPWQLSSHLWQLSFYRWQLSFSPWQLSFCHDNMTKLSPSVTKFFLHDKIFHSAKTFIVRKRAGHSHACVHKKMALWFSR